MIYADRFSGWVEVERLATNNSRNVQKTFLRWFATFGVPEEISTDGGPPFNSGEYDRFCSNWGVARRLSSAYYPTSNGRAEAALKSVKRILTGNINSILGSLDTTSATCALMAHQNTPAQDTGVSPSVLLFGRPMRDHLPRLRRELRPEWEKIAESREYALAKRVNRSDQSDTSRRELASLVVGDNVQIQNQHGNRPKRWYTTGVVTEVLPNRKYTILKDGSRRITYRNRRFLRKISPLCRNAPEVQLEEPTNEGHHSHNPRTEVGDPNLMNTTREVCNPNLTNTGLPSPPPAPRDAYLPPVNNTEHLPEVDPPVLRRSGRERKPRELFQAKMKGKHHEVVE